MNARANTAESTQVSESSGDVQQIREILFGAQMREYRDRFASIERSLQQQVEALSNTLEQRLAALSSEMQAVVARLDQRLQTQGEEGAANLDAAMTRSMNALKELGDALQRFQKQTQAESAAMRRDLDSDLAQLRSDMQQGFGTVEAEIAMLSENTEKAKVDRRQLSALLASLAGSLQREDE